MNGVAVAPSCPFARYEGGLDELGDDLVRGALSDTGSERDVAQGGVRMRIQMQQYLAMI